MSSPGTAVAKPTHVTETMGDRRKQRELAEARQSGSAAPEIDVKTGSMINPHNPEFITRRPWYLGGNDEGPSLDHQADQRSAYERLELSIASADGVVRNQRLQTKVLLQKGLDGLKVGLWVESLKRNRKPYLICQITSLKSSGRKKKVKVQYEDGSQETILVHRQPTRIRVTKSGSRCDTIAYDDDMGKETFDSKRDEYHGYDADHQHKLVQERYKTRDLARKDLRESELREKERRKVLTSSKDENPTDKNSKADIPSDSDSDSDYDSDAGSDSEEEFVQRDEDARVHTSRLARQGGVGGAQMKVTARNLRIREDTAKYLRNLDPNSAYYDPKSRSMRDNPNPDLENEENPFAGDNFARISGDAVGLAQTQLFAWDAASKKGGGTASHAANQEEEEGAKELHPQANPSQAEFLKKTFLSQKEGLKVGRKKAVLDKYGGAEYLDGGSTTTDKPTRIRHANERKVRFGTNVSTTEYTRDGRIKLPGGSNSQKQQYLPQKSKYEEDVYTNGHHTVFGSYFHKGAFKWGYKDDHSLMKNAYYTGAAGRVANNEANEMRYGDGRDGSAQLAQAREFLKAVPLGQRGGLGGLGNVQRSKLYGEADESVALDPDKLKRALETKKKSAEPTSKKSKYNSLNSDENDVTAEDMEAYRLTKSRGDDPMNKLQSEKLLEY
mmetsp:Transcript_8287/g.9744  ORF Transcript_8287/g.9744 Transcript_8287/m.9744 type:complete len:669 (-) Transcript_8287:193-2199(-)